MAEHWNKTLLGVCGGGGGAWQLRRWNNLWDTAVAIARLYHGSQLKAGNICVSMAVSNHLWYFAC